MDLLNRVTRTIRENKLIRANDSVLVALSGGPDSVALLNLLVGLERSLKLRISALYINHRIRPQAAKKEEVFCRNLSKKLRVKYVTVSENIPGLAKKVKRGIEETAREFRYEQLEKTANVLGCNKIALGHHLDDQVETVLFRILRGTGRTGLAGMPIKRGKYVRPLLEVTKSEILEYLKQNKIKYRLDRSNAKIEYTRNFIRHKLLPMIRSRINPKVSNAILNLIDTITPEEIFLERIVVKAFDSTVSFTQGGKLALALARFNRYDLWIQRRLLRRCIVKASGAQAAPDMETISQLLAFIKVTKRAVSIPGGINCKRTVSELYFFKEKSQEYCHKLKTDGLTKIAEIGTIRLKKSPKIMHDGVKSERRSSKVIVDFDKLTPPLLVRSIRAGDRFRPLGLNGTKKIGDYLTDRKVQSLFRNEIPVVADKNGIVWLVGFEIDENVKIDQKTKRVLSIEFNSGNKAKTNPI